MVRITTIAILLTACFVLPCLAQEPPAPPTVTAFATDQPVKIDGNLAEPCWHKAQPMTDFYVLGKVGERVRDTVAKVAHDSTWLYVGIACAHPALHAVKAQFLQHDGSVHTDESIEIFVDPAGNGNPYFHFKLNYVNVKAEQRATAAGLRDTRWDGPWLSATKIEAKGWNAEMAIPLYLLASYGDLSQARLNITRNEVVPQVDRQAATLGWTRQLSTWAPLLRTFHEPDLFGYLKGLKITDLQTPFLASFDNVQIGTYRLEGDRYLCLLYTSPSPRD